MTAATESPFRIPDQPLDLDIVAKYFRGLGDPTRLRILEILGDGERAVGDLVKLTGAPQPKVSSHLACLRWCGFVVSRREFRTVYYRIADNRVKAISTSRAHCSPTTPTTSPPANESTRHPDRP